MFVVFLPLHCCKSVHWALSLTASHCSSLFTLSSFSLSAFFLFYLPFLSLLFICLAMLEMLCVAVACMCISLKCRALCSEWSPPPKPPPSPHCQTVIRVKPGVSPTVPEGADLSTTSFHLCLNATALKADIHTPRHTHAHTCHLPGFFDCVTLIAHPYSLLLITLVSCLMLKMLSRKRMNSKSE